MILKIWSSLIILCLLSSTVSAEDVKLRFKSPISCTTEKGASVDLPPGRYLSEDVWDYVDTGWRVMENDNTRLKAENKELKRDEGTPWKVIGLALTSGIVFGALIKDRI